MPAPVTPRGSRNFPERRSFPLRFRAMGLTCLAVATLIAGLHACGREGGSPRGMIVLAIDGMDHRLVQRYLEEGRLPNIRRLIAEGEFKPLRTTIPPQSPVAWSTFITGSDPGHHGVFDFILRDPATMAPYRSTSRVREARRRVAVGSYVLPLGSGRVELLRGGRALWEYLAEEGVPATIVRIPASFPPPPSAAACLAGMGTPDLLGTPGTFSFFSERIDRVRKVDGGMFIPADVKDGRFDGMLSGPLHPLRRGHGEVVRPRLRVPFTVWIDRESRAAKFRVQETVLLLREGEWSDWIPLRFDAVPYLWGVRGICRFYLKEAGGSFGLYASPINIDPADPALPISHPEGFVRGLAEAVGPFYTQEMPEETKALTNDVLTDAEYLDQAAIVLDEQVRLFDHLLDRFSGGLLFYYFSGIDQGSHVFWRAIDPSHPLFTQELAERYGSVIPGLYEEMDRVIGRAMDRIGPGTALVVMSDHGFTSYRRSFHLNSWLLQEGYVRLLDRSGQGEEEYFGNVDWSGTRAYGLGLNGLYTNRRGRERFGIVGPGPEEDRLLQEIEERLIALRDPETGGQVVRSVFRPKEVYRGTSIDRAPDLVIGYGDGYRASWETILGGFPREILSDNLEKWSGDHCIDPEVVPGVLIANRPIGADDPTLAEVASAILAYFGVPRPAPMEGRPLFGE